jgi:thiosulfate/3-mercaptopyruvate sulfurtransferase
MDMNLRAPGPSPVSQSPAWPWIISGQEARQYIHRGATLLDARGKTWRPTSVPRIRWQWFTQRQPGRRGMLLDADAQIQTRLDRLGVTAGPVVVVGDPQTGWGQEGRIVWMLRSLGHPSACWVDGGWAALGAAGRERSPSRIDPPFRLCRTDRWSIDRSGLQRGLGMTPPPWRLIDTRTPAEYHGAILHGERRGGHIPGAILFSHRDWLTPDGYLQTQEALQQLHRQGIMPTTPVVAYCTGGIRSAWLVTVLTQWGYQAKNYAGSLWDWSEGSAADCPLVIP